mmetsp:Transcript_53283/g.103005  ORF Transcript_53283/g.103005 Transcript_53283/m.103005 type:complete len:236 (+) Transcript_53283:93-800(+)
MLDRTPRLGPIIRSATWEASKLHRLIPTALVATALVQSLLAAHRPRQHPQHHRRHRRARCQGAYPWPGCVLWRQSGHCLRKQHRHRWRQSHLQKWGTQQQQRVCCGVCMTARHQSYKCRLECRRCKFGLSVSSRNGSRNTCMIGVNTWPSRFLRNLHGSSPSIWQYGGCSSRRRLWTGRAHVLNRPMLISRTNHARKRPGGHPHHWICPSLHWQPVSSGRAEMHRRSTWALPRLQ